MACFSAHHEERCNASTVILSPESSDSEGSESEQPYTDIRVDLDKSNGQSIYVSQDNDKYGEEGSDWAPSPKKKAIGGSNGYPLNKLLRQFLTHLCKNPDYMERGQSITIVADSRMFW
jgi:hypothetical protein